MSRSFLIIVIGLVGFTGCIEEEGPPMYAKQEAPKYNVPQQVNLSAMGNVKQGVHLETVRDRMRRAKAGRPVFTGNPGPIETLPVPVMDVHFHANDPIDRPTFSQYITLPKYEEWRKVYSWLAYLEWQRQVWTDLRVPMVAVHLSLPDSKGRAPNPAGNPKPPLVPFQGTVTTHVCDPTGPMVPFPDPAIWTADAPLTVVGAVNKGRDPLALLDPKPHTEIEGWSLRSFRRPSGRWIVQ